MAAGLADALAAEVITNGQTKGRIAVDIGADRDIDGRTNRDLLVEHEAYTHTGQSVGLGGLGGLALVFLVGADSGITVDLGTRTSLEEWEDLQAGQGRWAVEWVAREIGGD